MTNLTTNSRSRTEGDQLSQEYKFELLKEARRVSPTEMPEALLDLQKAALTFLDCTGRHKEISTRVEELKKIASQIKNLLQLDDADDGIAAGVRLLKADSECGTIAKNLSSALATTNKQDRNKILTNCGESLSGLIEQLPARVLQDYITFHKSIKSGEVSNILSNPQYKKSGQLQSIEDVINRIKTEDLKQIPQLALELAVVIDKSSDVFKDGISETTALPRLRKIIKEQSGNLPELPVPDRSVSLSRFSDPDILEQFVLDKLHNDYDTKPKWSQLLSNEISGWEAARLMAASKELLHSDPKNEELRDTIRFLVSNRMNLDPEMVRLADNFHDRWRTRSDTARLKIYLEEHKKDSDEANNLAAKERIMKGKKGEFIGLLKKHVGDSIAINIQVNVEEGKWVCNPKDEPLKILRAAIDEKISSILARIESLEGTRRQQFTTEEALENYEGANNKDADLAEFRTTIQTFLDCGIYRGGDQAKDKMIRWFNAGLESIRNPSAEQTTEPLDQEEDDSNDFVKDFIRDEFGIDYDALELTSAATSPSVLYDLAHETRETLVVTLEDCLTEDSQGKSSRTEQLQSLVAEIIRSNINAFIVLGKDQSGMLAIDLAEAISRIVKDEGISDADGAKNLVHALRELKLLPIEATEEYTDRVSNFNRNHDTKLKSSLNRNNAQQQAETTNIVASVAENETVGENSEETSNGSADLTDRFQTILNNCLDSDSKPDELAGKSEAFIRAVADIVHYGFYHSGHIMRDIDLKLIKKFSGIQDKKLLEQAVSFLSSRGVLGSERKRSGPGSYRLSPRGEYDNSCSADLRNFIDAIRDLRNHSKIN